MLGTDLVYLPEFEKKLKNLELEKIFLSHELAQNKSLESLAGVLPPKKHFLKLSDQKKTGLMLGRKDG